jgi:hypothetical protein
MHQRAYRQPDQLVKKSAPALFSLWLQTNVEAFILCPDISARMTLSNSTEQTGKFSNAPEY